MNSSRKTRNNLRPALVALAATLAAASTVLAAGKSKGVDVEIPYEANVLKTSLTSPLYLNEASGGMVVSDAAGGVYMVTMGGKATELAGKSKVKHPAGVAVAPGGFGSAGTVYVLASGDDPAGPCEVDAIDKSGGVSTFAKLPDAAAASPPSVATFNSAPKA